MLILHVLVIHWAIVGCVVFVRAYKRLIVGRTFPLVLVCWHALHKKMQAYILKQIIWSILKK